MPSFSTMFGLGYIVKLLNTSARQFSFFSPVKNEDD